MSVIPLLIGSPQSQPAPQSSPPSEAEDTTQTSAPTGGSGSTSASDPAETNTAKTNASTRDTDLAKPSAEAQIASNTSVKETAAQKTQDVSQRYGTQATSAGDTLSEARDLALRYQQSLLLQNLVNTLQPIEETSVFAGENAADPGVKLNLRIPLPDTLPDKPR